MDPNADGPFQVQRVDDVAGLPSHSFFVPDALAKHGKYLIVVWTCGNGASADFYDTFLRRLASHGFLVVSNKMSSSDRQAEVVSTGKAIDWLVAETAKQGSPYYGKLDIDRIAVMGHSLGSLVSFAVAAMHDHVRASVHYSGGLTGNPVGFDEAPLAKMTKPAAFLCGGDDTAAGPACEMDFARAPMALPVFYGVLTGADHIGPFIGQPGGGEYGRAGVAWLRWQLAEDATYKSWFAGASCSLCTSPWVGKQRNLD